MSIQSQIDRINNAKSSLKSAISSKGVAVPESASIDDLPSLVRSIPQEGGSGDTPIKYDTLLPETTAPYISAVGYNAVLNVGFDFIPSYEYVITYNGTPYTCTAFKGNFQGDNLIGVGNLMVIGGANTGEPFAMTTTRGHL